MPAENPGSLFRARAVSHKMLGPPSAPVIALASYLNVQLILWVGLLMLASYLLTQASYKETVAVRGLLEPVQGVQEVVSPVAATVEKIHVRPGAIVEKGDILATLSAVLHNAEGGSTLVESIQQLRNDRELLNQQIQVQHQAQEQARYWSKLATENIENSMRSLSREADLLTTRLQLSERNLNAISQLLQAGNSSTREYDLQHQVHLELLSSEQTLSQRLLQYERQLHSLTNTQQLKEFDSKQSSLQIQREIQNIDQKITGLDNQAMFTVVAQSPGIVAELALAEGRPVRRNQPLFFINPSKSNLQVTLYTPAAVQAKLDIGQSVLIRYDAFDYRLHGRYEARIVSIGQARLDPRDIRLPIFAINEPVFKVVAELHKSTIGEDSMYVLQSGATLVADFVLSEMSLLQFIFKPILGLQGKVA